MTFRPHFPPRVALCLLLLLPAFLVSALAEERRCDLVVIGATPGGIACAVRAAREGLDVVLVQRTAHVGGFITSGAGGWEAPYDGFRSPLYAEVLARTTQHYAATYGEGSPQHRASMPDPVSRRHMDRPKVEPRVAEMVFEQMLAAEKKLTVLRGWDLGDVEREGALLRSVGFVGKNGQLRVHADAFVDATYEGDLLPLAKVAHHLGREARAEYGEPHAGVIFTRERRRPPGQPGWPLDAVEGRLNIRHNPASTAEIIYPQSTHEADKSIMAFNYRLILTRDPANRVPIPKPENYDREKVRVPLLGGTVTGLPNGKVAWNGGRLIGPQNGYIEADHATRARIEREYLDFSLGLLWFTQNDPEARPQDREKWKDWGLAKDEFADNARLPYEIYVREGRRLIGRHVFTEHDGVHAPGLLRTPIHGDSVAITDWPIDTVQCLPRKAGEHSNYDGQVFLSVESRPAQVPWRTLLPRDVENLLVPVALSASHVGWGAIRLEPVWMQTGEAAGLAAALAAEEKIAPAALASERLTRALLERKWALSFFNDADAASAEPWSATVQYFGTRGFFPSYDARPAAPLRKSIAAAWARAFAEMKSDAHDPMATAHAVLAATTGGTDSEPISAADFGALTGLDRAGHNDPISRGEACRLLFDNL